MNRVKTYLVEMPKNWKPGECEKCTWTHTNCPDNFEMCPLANAVGAVEIKKEQRVIGSYQPGLRGVWETTYKLDGKPVKLWATEVKP